jgi:probable DNA metabolism protein
MNDLFATEHSAVHSLMLASATDLEGFRHHARRLLALGATPADVSWHCSDTAAADLFAAAPTPACAPAPASGHSPYSQPASKAAPAEQPIKVPAGFMTLCETVILHNDPGRFGLLYRLLWRLVHEPALRHDPLDADWMAAQHMAQAVRRDMHKMKAFVRFRCVQDEIFKTHPESGLLHVAWFEPEHHIVEAITPFFVRRFTQMRWAILTPERCVEWEGSPAKNSSTRHQTSRVPSASVPPLPFEAAVSDAAAPTPATQPGVIFSPGANKADAPPADAGEGLWLTYYQHIFNPARLKLKMMQKEMPRKYWQNLPEAKFISALATCASQRHMAMIDGAPVEPRRRIPVFKADGAAASRLTTPGLLDTTRMPDSLAQLKAMAQQCRNCPIGQHATQAVCGEGPARANTMVVGEQPGDQEDLHGRPFVGPAGQLFDQALADLGRDRQQLFITNAVKHFKYEPRGKRRVHKTPSQQEAAACSHWLESEIALVKPRVALALGATAASSLLGRRVAVMSERGQWFARPDGLRVLVAPHPAALLRMEPGLRDAAYSEWLRDLKTALADADADDGSR